MLSKFFDFVSHLEKKAGYLNPNGIYVKFIIILILPLILAKAFFKFFSKLSHNPLSIDNDEFEKTDKMVFQELAKLQTQEDKIGEDIKSLEAEKEASMVAQENADPIAFHRNRNHPDA